ncbi:MAG: PepSY-like domain-containing protein [Alistipes sp.]
MKMKLSILGLVLAACAFTACDSEDKVENFPTPDAKTEVLMKKFPAAEGVYWHKSKDGKYDIATFKLAASRAAAKDSVEVWFGDQDQMRLVDQEIAFTELPAEVQAKFNRTQSFFNKEQYSNTAFWTIDDVCKIERDNVISYKIEVEGVKVEMEVDLYYDALGILLKEIEDADEDESDEAPLEIPENIMKWIQANYAKAEIVDYEAEVEDGVKIHDLDLKEGAVIIEIELTEKGAELIAIKEFNYATVEALPLDVQAKLKEALAKQTVFVLADVSDIEMMIEAGDEVYSFELEKDNVESELQITKKSDGTFVIGEIESEEPEEEEK